MKRNFGISLVGLMLAIIYMVLMVTNLESIHAKQETLINHGVSEEEGISQEDQEIEEVESEDDVDNQTEQSETEANLEPQVDQLETNLKTSEATSNTPSEIKSVEEPVHAQVNAKEVYDQTEVEGIQEESQKEPEPVIQPETSNQVATQRYAVESLGLQMNSNQLVALIHKPNSNHLAALNTLKVMEYSEEFWDETLLVVPQYIGSKVTVYQLKFEDGEVKEDYPVLETQITDENQILSLKCVLAEGIPQLKIVVEFQGSQVEYTIVDDGIGNRPQIEYF